MATAWKPERALASIRDAHTQLLAAHKHMVGHRYAFSGVHSDNAAALVQLRGARAMLDRAIEAIEIDLAETARSDDSAA